VPADYFHVTTAPEHWSVRGPFFAVPKGPGGLTQVLTRAGITLRRCVDVATGAKSPSWPRASPARSAVAPSRSGRKCARWASIRSWQSVDLVGAAHARFGAELAAAGYRVVEGAGEDPEGRWPAEPSYLVLGMALDAAQEVGRRYGQNAIVWAGADAVPELVLLR
jgi:hypothetical protein